MVLLRRLFSFSVLFFATSFAFSAAADWQAPEIRLPERPSHPVITLPSGGLERLREELARGGPHASELLRMIAQGGRALDAELTFPPRGGHHNQWYQCEDCQRPLRTVSETEHRCPQCDRVYSGEPYDDVVFRRVHAGNMDRMLNAAWTYALTGEDHYAEFAREVLLGYAERYMTYPYRQASRADSSHARIAGGRIFDQTLTESSYLLRQIAPAYDLIHDSGVMSEEDHQKVREGLLDPMIASIQRNRRGKSNWQSFHNAALFWIGAVIGDEALMKETVVDPEHGFAYQMDASVTGDGMWYEGSWSYHFYTLSALARQAQGASHLGIDLWNHPALKRMFMLPVDYLMSDGTLPRFGNATTIYLDRFGRGSTDLMEAAYSHYGEPALQAMLPERAGIFALLYGNDEVVGRGEVPLLPSVVLPDTGHAILRTHGSPRMSAAFQFAPHGGFHAHFDKLSFVLFAHGKELGVDRGRAASQAYRLPIHREWYRATISHNTVLVDLQSQRESGGELLNFLQTPSRAAVLARTGDAYPGVEHQRLLLMGTHYLVVFDRLEAEQERRFDWFYHNRGVRATSENGPSAVQLDSETPGFAYLRDVRRGEVEGMVRVQFEDEEVTTHLLLAGNGGGKLMLADGPGRSVEERIPLMSLTREGRSAEFAAVIEPVRTGEAPAIQRISVESDADATHITLEGAAGREVIHVFNDHRIQVTGSLLE